MTRKRRRIWMIGIGGVLLAASAVLVSVAMRDSIVFFFSPSEIAEKARGPDQRLRLGGLVAEGTWVKGVVQRFEITDGASSVPVEYRGVVPDLFTEGQGAIAEGYFRGGVFVADEILAKHDETYMPREVVDALKKQGVYKGEGG